MRSARMDEAQAGIKIARWNINNLKYADDTSLMAKSEEESNSLLIRVKKRVNGMGWNLIFKKLRSWYPVPSLHGK